MAPARRRTKDGTEVPIPPERQFFAKNLRRCRKEAGLTQEQVRERTGFAQSFISEVENGLTTISLDNAALLARVVGSPLWKLLREPSE